MPTLDHGRSKKRRADAEIKAAAKHIEQLLDELDPATVVVTRIPPRKTRPERRGGYPAGSKPASELRPPPGSITRPATDADDNQ